MVRPQLEDVPLANVRSVTYPAADGTLVPAYLTLPPGRRGARPAGGDPAAWRARRRATTGAFDWLAQYLANRGYAVLQPNYRGSAGYGDQWLQQNGFRSWRTSIGDINAGARWLAAQGIGDPSADGDPRLVLWRLCGAAGGGDRAGPVQGDRRDRAGHRSRSRSRTMLRNYTSCAQRRRLYRHRARTSREGSPLRTSRAITAPVLLFHGDRDLNVASHPFAPDGRRRCAAPASAASWSTFAASSTISPIPRRGRRCCSGSAPFWRPGCGPSVGP